MLRRRVSRDQAMEIARIYAEAQGWPWSEPVKVFRQLGTWRVMTAADVRGGNVNVWVNPWSGRVRRAGFAPR